MTVEAQANEATNQATLDVSSMPATAFPEGVDPATYVAGLSGQKAEGETAKSDAPVRPDHIPEKFWNAEKGTVDTDGLAKSYAELEKKFSGEKVDADADAAKKLTIDKPEEPVLGSAFEAFQAAYETNAGKVSDDDIAAIVKAGIPQQYVETYLAGLEALGQQSFAKAYEFAGGESQFNEAMSWAQGTLKASEIDAYNAMVSNPATMQQGIEWLTTKFQSARPSEGSFIETEAGGAQGDIFRSKAEMTTAFNDPRYRTDTAYQKDVAEKFARSKAAGTL